MNIPTPIPEGATHYCAVNKLFYKPGPKFVAMLSSIDPEKPSSKVTWTESSHLNEELLTKGTFTKIPTKPEPTKVSHALLVIDNETGKRIDHIRTLFMASEIFVKTDGTLWIHDGHLMKSLEQLCPGRFTFCGE